MDNPLAATFSGISTYIEGLRWLQRHPRYLFVLFLPSLFGLLSLLFILGLFFGNFFQIMDGIMFARPETWLFLPLYYLLYALLAIVLFLLSFIPPLLVSSVLAAPFYEVVSCAVERELCAGKVAEVSWGKALMMIIEELKKVAFILALTILALVIPGLNILALFIPAFLLGWDFCDYPLARRGWSFKRRLRFTFNNFWKVTGIGLWLIVPALQFVLAPLAVAGGTLLTIRLLGDDDSNDNN